MKTQSHPFHVRPAEVGDICVLLEPTHADEIANLTERQRTLQRQFGGQCVTPVHLTSARFAVHASQQIQDFTDYIRTHICCLRPISLTATGLQILEIPRYPHRLLKWQTIITDALRDFVACLNEAESATGVTPLYTAGSISSLVSALQDIPMITPAELNSTGVFPHALFTSRKIVISRIEDDGYTLLETLFIPES